MKPETKRKLLPLIMTPAVIAADQLAKLIVTLSLPEHGSKDVIGDFFRLTHRKNPFIIFSLGRDLPPFFQTVVFAALPLIALGLLVFFYFREESLRHVYRPPLAAILGGGIGNLLDRLLRPGGVVDFLDFKFYGILGLPRWPTFNLADLSITVSVIVILSLGLIQEIRKRRGEKRKEPRIDTDGNG